MKISVLGALLWLCFQAGALPAYAVRVEYDPEPSDSDALPAVKNLYTYFATRRDAPDNNMIEGQHLGGINQVLYPGKKFYGYFTMQEHGIDGRFPAMVGSRYDDADKETDIYRLDTDICERINAKLITIWHQYHPIVHLTAIPRNPWNQSIGRAPDDPVNKDQSLHDLLQATDLGTNQEKIDVRNKYWADIDVIAAGLAELQAEGISVVFRPFAEFNQTNKYYWYRQGEADCKALWIEVYNYYVNEKELHNLLFCWEVWALNRNDASADIGRFYPGSDYVDLVAGAYYFLPSVPYIDSETGKFSFDNSDPQDQIIYDYLISRDRPFGSAQFGLNHGTNVPGDHVFTLAFMDFATDLSFAYYWNQYQAVERQESKSLFVAERRVATSDDLPGFIPATIALSALEQTYDGSPRVVTAITDPNGLNVSITYDDSSTAPINAGSYTVVAALGLSHYTAEPVSDTLVVTKANQILTFNALSPIYFGETAPALIAESSSGAPVVFSLVSGDGAIIDQVLTYHSVGSLVIEANAGGDSNYEVAVPVQRDLEVLPSFYSWIEDAPLNDANGDGVPNLLAYGLGLSPSEPAHPASGFSPGLPFLTSIDGTFAIEFVIDVDRSDIEVLAEISTDLENWSEVPHTVLDSSGTLRRCRAIPELDPGTRAFFRVRIRQFFALPEG